MGLSVGAKLRKVERRPGKFLITGARFKTRSRAPRFLEVGIQFLTLKLGVELLGHRAELVGRNVVALSLGDGHSFVDGATSAFTIAGHQSRTREIGPSQSVVGLLMNEPFEF